MSDSMKETIDEEVKLILQQSKERSKKVLETQLPALHRLENDLR